MSRICNREGAVFRAVPFCMLNYQCVYFVGKLLCTKPLIKSYQSYIMILQERSDGMLITATELKNNLGKYLLLSAPEDDIIETFKLFRNI